MKGQIIKTGIDLGSKAIKVVVVSENLENEKIEILAATKELSSGIVHGQIVSVDAATVSVKKAIQKTEDALKVKLNKVSVGINTVCTKYTLVKIKSTVAKASNEVSELDLEKSKLEAIKTIAPDSPFEILHTHISSINIDGKRVKGSVIGQIGNSLEIYYILTIIPKKSLENIFTIFQKLNLEVIEINSNAFSIQHLLEKRDLIFGLGVLDIGSDNTIFTVYENGYPVSVTNYPIGGNAFNKDISIGMSVRMDEAETIKRNLKPSDTKKLISIIDARLDDFVDIINCRVAKAHTHPHLANGIILVGGGANLFEIKERLKHKLKLPILDSKEILIKRSLNILKDAAWTHAYTYSLVNFKEDNVFSNYIKSLQKFVKNLFQKLAP